jgi:hypothetical protein
MFGLFSSRSHEDPVLGLLTHSRGYWRGALDLGEGLVPLILAGGGEAPDAAALAEARALPARFPAWQGVLRQELFAHYQPYAEAQADGAPVATDGPFPAIATAAAVMAHASPAFVCIAPLDGRLVTELGYSVAWDAEHVVGVRFAGPDFLALCGSTRKP